MSGPIDIAVKRTEQQAAQAAQQPRMQAQVQMLSGQVAVLDLPIPLTPVDVVRLVVALSDIVTGRTAQPSPAERIWKPQ